jgi:hypothetical protein
LSQISIPVIVTTHSPALVKYADPSSLVILRSQTPDEVTSYQLSSTFPAENKKQLSQLMRLDGAEVFFARVILAVEGDSELIALSAFAEQLGCDLDRDGISVLNVGSSNNYEPILRAFTDQQFSMKYIVIYDQDVLQNDPGLVRQAVKLGLVSKVDFQACRKDGSNVVEKRKSLLNYNIGWFGAEECFEQVLAECGYLDTMIEAIQNNDKKNNSDYKALEKYLEEESLSLDAHSLASFIKGRDTLKVPIAHAVADAVKTCKFVPDCFAAAIRHASLLSLGGIQVDDYFVLRACAAGFKDVLFKLIEDEGFTSNLGKLTDEHPQLSDAQLLQSFFGETNEGLAIRHIAKSLIADTVEDVGCSDYADAIRNTEFPQQEV